MSVQDVDTKVPEGSSRRAAIFNRIGSLLQIAAVLFVISVFWRGLETLGASRFTAPRLELTLGLTFLAAALGMIVQICGLRVLLEGFTATRVPFRRAFFFQGRTAIAKYLPGNVFHFVGRQLLACELGWTQQAVLLTSAAETAVLVAAPCAMGLAGLLLAKDAETAGVPRFLAAAALAAGAMAPLVAVFSARLLAAWPPAAAVVLHLKALRWSAWAEALLWNALFIVCGTAALALGLHLFSPAGLEAKSLPALLFAFSVSFVAGFVTPGAPGGVGVREALLILCLGPAFGSGPVSAAAVLARLGSILAEGLAWLLARFQQDAIRNGARGS